MFVILNGKVTIQGKSGYTLATLGTGAVFGEIALFSESPRTADVIAKEDVEVLIITQHYLKRVMRAMPEVSVTLLFNLSRLLSERLSESTRQWIDASGNAAAAVPQAAAPAAEASASGATT